jgi:hypothetical protein
MAESSYFFQNESGRDLNFMEKSVKISTIQKLSQISGDDSMIHIESENDN